MTPRDERAVPADRLTLAVLAVTALVVRIPGIGGDLWLDEIATLVSFVQPPLSEIVTSYESPNNHVFYSVLAHIGIALFGERSWALRLPALLFGAATVPALYYLARSWLPRAEALGAAAVLTFSYHHAYFSQNARGYTGLLFLAVLSTALLARALTGERRGPWIGYAVATAAMIYLLLTGVFVAAGQVLGAVVAYVLPAPPGRRRALALRLAAGVGGAALLTLLVYAPLLRQMFEFYTTAEGDVGWRPSLELLRIIVRDALPALPALLYVAAAVALPVLAAGFISLVRRAPLLFFALALPPLLELGTAMAMGVGTYPRRFLLLLPFAVLVGVRGAALVAELAARLAARPAWRRPAFAALTAAGTLAGAVGLPRLYRLPKQDYTGAIEYVRARRAPSEPVAAAYVAEGPARYYDPSVRSARTAEDLRRILAEDAPAVWLLGSFVADMERRDPALSALIAERFEEVERFLALIGDGAVVVWKSTRP